MKTRLCIGLALLLLASATPVQGQLGAWDLGIEYPGDNEDMPFNVDKDGRSTIQFFVNNDEFQDIEVEFEYDIPFAGEADGPESETISGGSNETFTLSVSGIDVWNYAADSKGEFTITANLVSRAGLPIGLPGESEEASGWLKIPRIYSMELDVADPVGPMNAGSDVILRVTVTNTGNVQDKVGEVEVADNCPLLTTDNGLDVLMTRDINAGQTTEADLRATASESHPRRNCKIEVTVSSNGAMNSGGSVLAGGETTVTVEPPLEEPDDSGDSDDPDNPVEVISSSLPAPGVASVFCALAMALIASNRRR